MTRAWRLFPGIRGATMLLVAALVTLLPVFPTVSMSRASRTTGGDEIGWGVRSTTLREHLLYERTWAEHRPTQAVLLDVAHPLGVALFASGLATLVMRAWSSLGRRARVECERTARAGVLWGTGVLTTAFGIRAAVGSGTLPQSPVLLFSVLVVAAALLLVFVLRTGPKARPLVLFARAVCVVALGLAIAAALLSFAVTFDEARLRHVGWTWAGTLVASCAARSFLPRRPRAAPRSV